MIYLGQPKVYRVLDELQIPYLYHQHPPIPTVKEALNYWIDSETTYCKNLFFRNHKGNRHYLVILEYWRAFNIRELEIKLKQGKISFASEQRLQKYLGLQPGSVSPFGLINDIDHHVFVFFDKSLKQASKISFHPNDNRVSLILPADGFWKYMEWTGNGYEFICMQSPKQNGG